MSKCVRIQSLLIAAVAIAAQLATSGVSLAGDYESEDFSLRFPAALTRFSTFADVAAAGGASAGSKWCTAVNPASTDWDAAEGKLGTSVCPQWNRLSFDNGTKIDVWVESVTVDSRTIGTFVIGAAQISRMKQDSCSKSRITTAKLRSGT